MMEARPEDLNTYSEISSVCCLAESEFQCACDSLAAASLIEHSPSRALERAAQALLERVRQQRGGRLSQLRSDSWLSPLFRMTPEERLILVALHSGRWSYARLERILALSVDQIQILAWSARLQVSTQIDAPKGNPPGHKFKSIYPSAPSIRGASCPDFDPHQPWFQRFLDDEITSRRDQVFLQNHLMVCDSCRHALDRCRAVYDRADQEVKTALRKLGENHLEQEGRIEALRSVIKRGAIYSGREQMSTWESLVLFSQQPRIRIALFVFVGVLVKLLFD